MTQATSRPTIAISLTSMQSPEAFAGSALSLKSSKNDEVTSNDLLLRPREPGQMLVTLENLGERKQRWKLELEGDFPEDWCQWNQEDFEEIASQEKISTFVTFQVPENFFENQLALKNESQLQINYQCSLCVYIETRTQQQPVAYRVFNLFVRPLSFYLNYLPALYREVDLVGRLLSIFEQAFDPTVQTINTLWAYLDPLTAPEAMLPFLAHWVAWDMDTRWSFNIQRRLIKNALVLYRWHGTRWGLRFYLHLFTGLPLDEEHIKIREIFEQGFVLGTTQIGIDSMLGGRRPYHFIVELRQQYPAQIDEASIRKIIERQKPAFSTYELSIIDPPE
ncbi:phage tail protein [Scytonema sp. NUACC26]|uniref:phage tail protein n=1 Tax=Scytonema sp. NUACC26 TaxID=3140176 RepID=UPI0034DC6A78